MQGGIWSRSFITDKPYRKQPKVMQSLRFALQPSVVNISVDWTLQMDLTVDTLSPTHQCLFSRVKWDTHLCPNLKGEGDDFSMLSIHRLAARTRIRSLEQEERSGAADVEDIRKRMVELSVQAGVSSVHTAFIAVNKNHRETVKGPLLKRRVLTRVSHFEDGSPEDYLISPLDLDYLENYDDDDDDGGGDYVSQLLEGTLLGPQKVGPDCWSWFPLQKESGSGSWIVHWLWPNLSRSVSQQGMSSRYHVPKRLLGI
ncbi:hypothetical protein QQF64_018743 [Cirrhinus molitorella]|uniref:Uncharacterized protein n=1 Tax=Cirrhinus molitorella TaxID=172907 RepID=A0ABR3LH05_9TELE